MNRQEFYETLFAEFHRKCFVCKTEKSVKYKSDTIQVLKNANGNTDGGVIEAHVDILFCNKCVIPFMNRETITISSPKLDNSR